MSLVPSGCITVREALDRVGQEHFGPQWTGKEHKARADLPSDEEWQRRKELVKQKIAGAKPFVRPTIFGIGRGRDSPSTKAVLRSLSAKLRTSSPSAEFGTLQAERDAYERLEKARHLLRKKLEAREWKAVVVDPSNGFKRPLSDAVWRTSNAKIYIERGRAPVSRSSGWGDLFIVEPGRPEPKPEVEPRVVGEATHVSAPAAAKAPVGTMEALQQVMSEWDSIGTTDSTKIEPAVPGSARENVETPSAEQGQDVAAANIDNDESTHPPKPTARRRSRQKQRPNDEDFCNGIRRIQALFVDAQRKREELPAKSRAKAQLFLERQPILERLVGGDQTIRDIIDGKNTRANKLEEQGKVKLSLFREFRT